MYGLSKKGKNPEITKEKTFFEWIPGITIMDQAINNNTPASDSDNEVKSLHSSDTNTKDDITVYEEEGGYA